MNNIFEDFFPNGLLSKEIDFVVCSMWQSELTKWLECVYEIDPGYYNRAKTRIHQDASKQEELLAEVRSMYFLQKCGCVITSLEPGRLDFTFTDIIGAVWNAEVKCPSYLGEIFELDIPKQNKLIRKQQPKFINEDTFSFSCVDRYQNLIEPDLLEKFESGNKNLLIISDDLFVSLIGDPFLEENIKNALQEGDPDSKISAVLLLRVQSKAFENFIDYQWRLVNVLEAPQM